MMEEKIFHEPEVLRHLRNYVEIRLHVDGAFDWSRELARIQKVRHKGDVSIPYYEIVDPETVTIETIETAPALGVFRGADLTGERFARFLERHARKPR